MPEEHELGLPLEAPSPILSSLVLKAEWLTLMDLRASRSSHLFAPSRMLVSITASTCARASSSRWFKHLFQAWKAPSLRVCLRSRIATVCSSLAVRYLTEMPKLEHFNSADDRLCRNHHAGCMQLLALLSKTDCARGLCRGMLRMSKLKCYNEYIGCIYKTGPAIQRGSN